MSHYSSQSLTLTRRRAARRRRGRACRARSRAARTPCSSSTSPRATCSRCRSRCRIFSAATANEENARDVTGIISNNLQRSGLFAPIDPAAFIEKISNSDAVPRFPDWRAINAQALVTGRITRQPDGRLKAEFRLWDVFAGQQLAGKQYFTRRTTGGGSRTSSQMRSTSA